MPRRAWKLTMASRPVGRRASGRRAAIFATRGRRWPGSAAPGCRRNSGGPFPSTPWRPDGLCRGRLGRQRSVQGPVSGTPTRWPSSPASPGSRVRRRKGERRRPAQRRRRPGRQAARRIRRRRRSIRRSVGRRKAPQQGQVQDGARGRPFSPVRHCSGGKGRPRRPGNQVEEGDGSKGRTSRSCPGDRDQACRRQHHGKAACADR